MRIGILVLLVILFINPLGAQHFKAKKLSVENGLSHSSNHFRYEDKFGFMWISAPDALNRFDGNNIKVYKGEKYFPDGNSLQMAVGFAEDDSGNLYIGSKQGLFKYIRKKEIFFQVIIDNKALENIYPIGFIGNNLWIFTGTGELLEFNLKDSKIAKKIKFDAAIKYEINRDNGYKFNDYPFIDMNQNIWFNGEKEFYLYNIKSNQFRQVSLGNSISKITAFDYLPSKNRLYFTTAHNVYYLNCDNKTIQQIKITVPIGKPIYCGIRCNGKTLIWSDQAECLNVADVEGLNAFQIKIHNENWNSLIRFCFDKKNRLWACDNGNGVIILDFEKDLFNKITHYEDNTNSPVSVGGIFGSKSGKIYTIGAKIGYLNRNKNNYVVSNFSSITSSNYIFIKSEFHNVDFLVCQGQNNLDCLYKLTSNDELIKLHNNIIPIDMGVVTHAQVLDENWLLLACTNGLLQFNIENGSKIFYKNRGISSPFYINKINTKLLAIGYIEGGLWLVSFEDNKLKFQKNILPGVTSFYLQKDNNGNYWLGTALGVYTFNKDFKILDKYLSESELAGTFIYGLLIDENNTVWVSHQRGMSSINVITKKITNYTPDDGLQDWDFNNRSFYKSASGELFFGGIRGLNYFTPPLIIDNVYDTKLYIDELRIGNMQLPKELFYSGVNEISIPESENNIRMFVNIQDLDMNEPNEFYYRINNTDWKLSKVNILEIASIAFGITKIELGIMNDNTSLIVTQKTILMNKKLPLYRSPVFWTILISAIVLLIVFFINRGILNKRTAELAKQLEIEAERSRLTADLHDDIGATLSSLQLNSSIAQHQFNKDPNSINSILLSIENQCKTLSENIGDFIWSIKSDKNEFMTLSSRIKTFVSDILGSTNIHYNINIQSGIDKLPLDFKTRKNIVLIFKEAINNAAKYSKASEIRIELHKVNNFIELEIVDNGIGISSGMKLGNGIGNMNKRAKELNGDFQLNSNENKGTSIKVKIPLP